MQHNPDVEHILTMLIGEVADDRLVSRQYSVLQGELYGVIQQTIQQTMRVNRPTKFWGCAFFVTKGAYE